MCGLFGAYSTVLTKEEIGNAMFLGFLAQSRGSDSTGIAILGRSKKGKIRVEKHRAITHMTNFMRSSETHNVIAQVNQPCLIMGHCRAATLGTINHRNTHPIEEGSILGCHNGTIRHFFDPNFKDTVSDSRVLFQKINSKPLDEALRDCNYGPYALTWIDFRNRSLNFVRNSGNPLWFMKSNSNTIYWASEPWMLRTLADRQGTHHFQQPYMLVIDKHHSFELFHMNENSVDVNVSPRCVKCNKSYLACTCDRIPIVPLLLGKKEDLSSKKSHIFERPLKGIVELDEGIFRRHAYKGWNGSLYSVAKVFDKLAKAGCDGCKRSCAPLNKVYWFAEDAFVCQECYESNDVVINTLKDAEVFESECYKVN